MTKFLMLLFCCWLTTISKDQQQRWNINGKEDIEWKVNVTDTPHTDHIEMSGKQVSAIISYGTTMGQQLVIKKRFHILLAQFTEVEKSGQKTTLLVRLYAYKKLHLRTLKTQINQGSCSR